MKDRDYALLGFVCVCLLVFMFVSVFVIYFTGPNASSQHLQYFGQVGDFFGGMLNPILAFASFIALLYTIRIQSEELRLTRQEFEKSSKAQQEIANTAKEQLTQASLLEDYKYVSVKLRNLSEQCHQIINSQFQTSISFNQSNFELTVTSLHELLVWLSFQFGATSRMDTGSSTESLTKARDWLIENIPEQYEKEMKLQVSRFLGLSRMLNQTLETHSDLCKQLKTDGWQGSVSQLDAKEAASWLAKGYMLSSIFNSYQQATFVPASEKAKGFFKESLENWGLNIDTF